MRILLLTLSLAIAGCDVAAESPVDAQALTADASPPDGASPTRPLVTGIGVPAQPAGVVALAISVRDATSPTVALRLLFSCDDTVTWQPATALDPLTDLAAGAAVVTHTIRWDARADVDLLSPRTCFVAAVAIDPGGLSSETLVAQVVFRDGGGMGE